jgi:hypothetical protein
VTPPEANRISGMKLTPFFLNISSPLYDVGRVPISAMTLQLNLSAFLELINHAYAAGAKISHSW